jgi:Fe-S-cluster containining protein
MAERADGKRDQVIAPTGQSDAVPGVSYECQRCGNCCRWPGDVVVDDAEIEAIAAHVGMNLDHFIQQHTRLRMNRTGLSLIEKSNGECDFLDGIDCRINPVKPAQCRGFPNTWNFPGWRKVCEAIPVSTP